MSSEISKPFMRARRAACLLPASPSAWSRGAARETKSSRTWKGGWCPERSNLMQLFPRPGQDPEGLGMARCRAGQASPLAEEREEGELEIHQNDQLQKLPELSKTDADSVQLCGAGLG